MEAALAASSFATLSSVAFQIFALCGGQASDLIQGIVGHYGNIIGNADSIFQTFLYGVPLIWPAISQHLLIQQLYITQFWDVQAVVFTDIGRCKWDQGCFNVTKQNWFNIPGQGLLMPPSYNLGNMLTWLSDEIVNTDPSQSIVAQVYQQAKANGLSETDAELYALTYLAYVMSYETIAASGWMWANAGTNVWDAQIQNLRVQAKWARTTITKNLWIEPYHKRAQITTKFYNFFMVGSYPVSVHPYQFDGMLCITGYKTWSYTAGATFCYNPSTNIWQDIATSPYIYRENPVAMFVEYDDYSGQWKGLLTDGSQVYINSNTGIVGYEWGQYTTPIDMTQFPTQGWHLVSTTTDGRGINALLCDDHGNIRIYNVYHTTSEGNINTLRTTATLTANNGWVSTCAMQMANPNLHATRGVTYMFMIATTTLNWWRSSPYNTDLVQVGGALIFTQVPVDPALLCTLKTATIRKFATTGNDQVVVVFQTNIFMFQAYVVDTILNKNVSYAQIYLPQLPMDIPYFAGVQIVSTDLVAIGTAAYFHVEYIVLQNLPTDPFFPWQTKLMKNYVMATWAYTPDASQPAPSWVMYPYTYIPPQDMSVGFPSSYFGMGAWYTDGPKSGGGLPILFSAACDLSSVYTDIFTAVPTEQFANNYVQEPCDYCQDLSVF